jgi:hypothetical protein
MRHAAVAARSNYKQKLKMKTTDENQKCSSCEAEEHWKEFGVWPSREAMNHWSLYGCTCEPDAAEEAEAWLRLISD